MEVNMLGVENDGGDGAAVDRTLLEKNSNASLESSDKTTETRKSTISRMENDKDNNGVDTLTKAESMEMKKLLAKKPSASQGLSHQIKLSLKGMATLGENLNPNYLQNLEAATVGTVSGTPAANIPASKKKKKQKKEKKNPASGDVILTCEINKVIANEGPGATKVLEPVNGEIDLSKSTISDAQILSRGEHADITISKAGSSATTNLNVNGIAGKEAVNGEMGSGTTAADTTRSKKRK